MKIGFYLDNRNFSDVDLSTPRQGNPGIGGTEYMEILIATCLSELYQDKSITIFLTNATKVSSSLKFKIVNDYFEAANASKEIGIDVLVLNYKCFTVEFCHLITKLKLNTVCWGQNFYSSKMADHLSSCQFIKRNVFVGKQQYDRYVDHKIIKKSTWIYNAIDVSNLEMRNDMISPVVTYLGSITPAKNFHLLASQWKYIVKRVPNAQLNIIGSGQLYDRTKKMGPYNIAEESYEKMFIDGITENGVLMSSVNMLGIMGPEKKEVFKRTSVGVVNPGGDTETFCIAAIEMQSYGVPIVTINRFAFPDTVKNKVSGLLYNRRRKLGRYIVRLLKQPLLNVDLSSKGQLFVAENFNVDKICLDWINLFDEIRADSPPKYHSVSKPYFIHNKYLRVVNRMRQLRNDFSSKSLIEAEESFKSKTNKFKTKYKYLVPYNYYLKMKLMMKSKR